MHEGMPTQRREEKRVGERTSTQERECAWLAPFLIWFFLPLEEIVCKLGSQKCCLFTWGPHSGPRTFLWPSSVLFSWAFPFLVFQPPPSWTPVSYSNYLTLISLFLQLVIISIFWLQYNYNCKYGTWIGFCVPFQQIIEPMDNCGYPQVCMQLV